jgi:hypothetical protein
MALELDYNICSNKTCTKLTFTESTGEYNAVSNDTGYDESSIVANHPSVSDMAAAVLSITTPEGDITVIDLLPESFPTIDDEQEYEITAVALGYASKLTDGIYDTSYTVTSEDVGEPGIFTKTKYVFVTCNAECCIDKLYAAVKPSDCTDCEDKKLAIAIEAEGYLCAAKKAFACGKLSLARTFLEKVQYLCANSGCKCC